MKSIFLITYAEYEEYHSDNLTILEVWTTEIKAKESFTKNYAHKNKSKCRNYSYQIEEYEING